MSKRSCTPRSFLVLLLIGGLVVLSLSKPSRIAETHFLQEPGQVEVVPATRTTTSTEALRGMPPPPVTLGAVREKKRIHLNPNVLVSLGPARRDPVLQSSVMRRRQPSRGRGARAQTPVPGKNLEGIGDGFTGPQGAFSVHGAPPDTSGAVGDTQYVQFVNESFAVFNKATGAIELGPVLGKVLWRPLGGNCTVDNDGDPVVQFDKIARRWVISQFSVSSGFSQCVAVSTTSNATGTYHLYEFTYPAFNDYPKMGVWPDGYYVSFNVYNSHDRLIGPRACVYDRKKMLQGLPATQQCFQLSSIFFGLLPTDLDGASSALADAQGNANGPAAPPARAPNYYLLTRLTPNTGGSRVLPWTRLKTLPSATAHQVERHFRVFVTPTAARVIHSTDLVKKPASRMARAVSGASSPMDAVCVRCRMSRAIPFLIPEER